VPEGLIETLEDGSTALVGVTEGVEETLEIPGTGDGSAKGSRGAGLVSDSDREAASVPETISGDLATTTNGVIGDADGVSLTVRTLSGEAPGVGESEGLVEGSTYVAEPPKISCAAVEGVGAALGVDPDAVSTGAGEAVTAAGVPDGVAAGDAGEMWHAAQHHHI
jgi:hypothetical protein